MKKRLYLPMIAEILHAGHISFLKKARSLVENPEIIIGLLSDEDAADAKRVTVCNLEERSTVMKHCDLVDEVIAPAPRWLTREFIEENKIDYVVHGDDWNPLLEYAYQVPIKMGIMKKVPYTPGISTTKIYDHLDAISHVRKWRQDFERTNERDMAHRFKSFLFRMFGHKRAVRGVEVGVFRGEHSKAMLDALASVKLVCVDMWEMHAEIKNYSSQDIIMNKRFSDIEYAKSIREDAELRLKPYDHRVKIIQNSSIEASKMFENETFDFVYLDGDHSYEGCISDMIAWYPKVKTDGYLCGHDYKWEKSGVDIAVDEFNKKYGFNLSHMTFPGHEWILGPIYHIENIK